jgi:TfoX/Sxy family transcriptional regulator of competence genes
MAYDEALADRIRRVLGPRPDISEKKMFGGLAFLRDGKMFVGIVKDDLMVRVGPEGYEAALAKAHVRPMDFTGRPMNGYVFVGASGCRTDKAVKAWVKLGDAFVATMKKGSRTLARGEATSSSRPRLNVAWHGRHPMPKNPTTEQRLAWHQAHEKSCGCRPMPAKLRALLR